MPVLSVVFVEYFAVLQAETSHQVLLMCYSYLSSQRQKYIGIFLIRNIRKAVSKYYLALSGYSISDCAVTQRYCLEMLCTFHYSLCLPQLRKSPD